MAPVSPPQFIAGPSSPRAPDIDEQSADRRVVERERHRRDFDQGTDAPRVAVLIPTYNSGPRLQDTLLAIQRQHVRCHIFVVDDGSDPPVEVEPGPPHQQITVIRMPTRGGVTRALNAGLERILQGDFEYVAREDAGDVDLGHRLARQVAYLDDHPDVALLGGWTRSLDATGASLFVTEYPCSAQAVRRRMRYRSAMSHSTCMLRVSALRTFGGYNERYEVGQDLELFRRIAEQAPCVNLPEVLVLRIEEPTSVTMSRRARSAMVRLLIQARYLSLRDPHSVLGIGRSLLMLLAPARLSFAYKKWRGIVR